MPRAASALDEARRERVRQRRVARRHGRDALVQRDVAEHAPFRLPLLEHAGETDRRAPRLLASVAKASLS